MSDQSQHKIEIELQPLIELAVEHWRLERSLSSASAGDLAPARHATRRIGDFLKRFELEARSLDGMACDAGLAARVVDVVDDPALPAGEAIVDETLSPLVLWRGKVIKQADVATRRGTGKSAPSNERRER